MYKSYDQLGSEPDTSRDILDVLEVKNSQHRAEIISQNELVCVDIYADWCGPCKQTAPDYSLVAKTYSRPGLCAIVKQNFDTLHPSEKNKINGIPLFLFYLKGLQVNQIVGADISAVEEMIKKYLQNQGSIFSEKENENIGPQFSRNSIRNTRNSIPDTRK